MKLSLTKLTIIATLTGAAAGGAALANQSAGDGKQDDRKPRAERMFERMDADSDGKVTLEDAKAFAAKRFAKRDTDGDGVISREDRQQFRANRRDERRTERFAKIDVDGDGSITLEEFKQAEPARKGRGMRGDRAGRGEGHRGQRGLGKRHGRNASGKRGHRMGRGMMRGPLTIQEAEARAVQRFERIDTDADGVITLEDIKAFKPQRGHRGRRG